MARDKGFIVWLVAMLKGGTRKSTTAMMLAFELAWRGRVVLVIDIDLHTQGVTEWTSTIYADGGEPPFSVVQWNPATDGLLVPFVQRWQRELVADYVIIDAGAEEPDAIRNALPLVDLVVGPTGPEQAEISRVSHTAALVGSRAPLHLLLTRVDSPGAGAARDARAGLEQDGYRVLSAEVPRSRDTYAHVFGRTPTSTGAYADVCTELVARQRDALTGVC